MDKLSIDNSVLLPSLAEGWALNRSKNAVRLKKKDTEQGFEVNEISAMILAYCDGIHSVEQIIANLSDQFPDAADAIPGDVETLLRDLHDKGVLSFIPKQAQQIFPVEEKSPPHGKKCKLCIGMATYDDYDGVYFSVQAIRLYHPEVLDDIEIVVVDNHPTGVCAKSLKNLCKWIPNYRYIPFDQIRGTAIKGVVFREATSDFVLCIDSHVMIAPGAIARLLDYFQSTPDTIDLLQGPLLNDDMQSYSTHFEPGWSSGMYGTWAYDERGGDVDAPGFDIPMQGMGLFACSKKAWLGFNSRFAGFVGEEGYVHEKFRQAGGRTLCLPFLRWLHRFNRPMGTRYSLTWEDRIRNYLIGYDELGLETDELIEHFKTHVGEATTMTVLESVQLEMSSPFYYFDAIYHISGDDERGHRVPFRKILNDFGILHRAIRINPEEMAGSPQAALLLAHQLALQEAKESGLENALIIDLATFADLETHESLKEDLRELGEREWRVLSLDRGSVRSRAGDEGRRPDDQPLAGSPGTIAYHRSVFAKLLAELPKTEQEADTWLQNNQSFQFWLERNTESV